MCGCARVSALCRLNLDPLGPDSFSLNTYLRGLPSAAETFWRLRQQVKQNHSALGHQRHSGERDPGEPSPDWSVLEGRSIDPDCAKDQVRVYRRRNPLLQRRGRPRYGYEVVGQREAQPQVFDLFQLLNRSEFAVDFFPKQNQPGPDGSGQFGFEAGFAFDLFNRREKGIQVQHKP